MPTAIFTETWEGATAGTTCTNVNTGFASISNYTFAATAVAPGSGQSGHFNVTSANAGATRNFTASPKVYVVIPLRSVTAPTGADAVLCSARNTGTKQADLQITTDLRVRIRNLGSVQVAQSAANLIKTGSTSAADGRIEWILDTVAGTQQVRVYNTPTSSTPDYDSGVLATTAMASIDSLNTGAVAATTWEAYIGDLSAYSDGLPTYGTSIALSGNATPVAASTSATTASIVVPTGAAVGDQAALILSGSDIYTNTAPTGWSRPVPAQSKAGICLDIWTKTLVSGDLGSTVTITSNNTVNYKRTLELFTFSNGQVGDAKSNLETVAGTAHNTPPVNAIDPTAWALVGVADRASPGSQSWTLGSGLTSRAQSFGSGGGAVSVAAATATPGAAGTVGPYTITGTVSTATAAMWAMVIEPATVNLGGSVNAGADIVSEPRVALTRTATATGSPVSWSWAAAPGSPSLTLTGATTATVGFTTPPAIALTTYTLRATATYANGSTAYDDLNVTVYPVTRRFFAVGGGEVPLRVMRFT